MTQSIFKGRRDFSRPSRQKKPAEAVGKSPKKNPFKSGIKAARKEHARRKQGTTTIGDGGLPRNKPSMSLLQIKPGTRKRSVSNFKNAPVTPLQRKEGFDKEKKPNLRGRHK